MEAPLGAGKTFFLNTVLGQYMRQSRPVFDELRNRQIVLATAENVPDEGGEGIPDDLEVSHEALDAFVTLRENQFAGVEGLRLLLVEELDRKASLGQVLWTIASAQRWLVRGGDRVLILTGDRTLQHERVRALLSRVDKRTHLDLDPLTDDLLCHALEARILAKVVGPANPADPTREEIEAATTAASQVLEDEYVRWASVPRASAELATFRDALGALRRMCERTESLTNRVSFPRGLVRALRSTGEAPSGPAAQLESAITALVRDCIASATPLTPLSMADLAGMVGADAGDRFREYVIDLQVQLRLLAPLGIPFTETGRWGAVANVGPFVPGYALVHKALNELVRE